MSSVVLSLATLAFLVSAQQLLSDPGTSGPQVEVVHLYYDEWPTGSCDLSSLQQNTDPW